MSDTILVVDDEPDLRELVSHHLKRAGFRVLQADRGLAALELARAERPHLILLDIMLPDMLGTDVLRALKQGRDTAGIPVLCLTARGDEVDRVVGFELGAEDYVVKPFSPRELVLRVQSLLRRTGAAEPGTGAGTNQLTHGDLVLDREGHVVTVSGHPLDLTPTEFNLLTCFMERPGKVMNRERLLNLAWGDEVYVTDRTVDTHVKRLRSKMGTSAHHIETVRGVGYRFKI